jgi:hypothetical protein
MMAQNANMSFITEFYRSRPAGVILATALLTSCSSSETPKSPPQLHLACQTVECDCRAPKTSLFSPGEKTEVIWRQNGDAACPPGFTLERVEVDFLGRRK